MRNFWLLSKVLLKSIGDIFGVETNPKKRRYRLIGIIVLIAVMGLSYVAPLWALSFTFTEQLRAFDLTDLIPLITVPVGILMTVIFSLFTVIGMFYLSTDTRLLLPLPFKPWQIVAARFVTSLVTIYMVEVLFFIPALTGWVVGAMAPFDVYIHVLLVLLISPLAPTAVMTLLIGIVMAIMPQIKNKDTFTYFVMFIAVGLSIGLSVGMQTIFSYLELDPAELATNLQAIVTSLQTLVTSYLPFMIPVYNSLLADTVFIRALNFLIYFTGSAVIVILVIILLAKIYINGVMGMGEAPSKKKALSQQEWTSQGRDIPVFWRYAGKELKTILRSPTFFLNLVFVNVLVPVIMIVSMTSMGSALAEDPDMQALLSLINSIDGTAADGKTVSIMLGLMIFFTGLSMISPTAISREGKNAWFMKMIPVPAITQINIKVFWGIAIASLTYFVLGIALSVIGVIDILSVVVIYVPYIAIQLFANYLGILFDLWWPKLNWDNEAVPVKQNLNGVYYMLLEMALAVALGFGGFYLIDLLIDIPGYLWIVIVFVIFGSLALFIYRYIANKDDKIFERIS